MRTCQEEKNLFLGHKQNEKLLACYTHTMLLSKKCNITGFALKSKRSELIKDQGIFAKKQILGREFTRSYHNKLVKYGAFQLVSTFFIILL